MYPGSTTTANEVWQILANRAEDGTGSFTDRCIGDQQDENRDAFACSKRSCANSMSARRQPPCRFKGAWARIEPNSQRVFQRAELGRQLHVLAVLHETAMTE
jgi:hypothetical protein